MSSDFEWHFGDEFPDEKAEEEQREERKWRRWVPWLLALLLIAGTAAVWWRGRQRTLAQAEAQVQQVAQLEFRALAEGDEELFLSLQDPSDRSWKAAQAAYVDSAGLPLPLQGLTTPVSTSIESARVVGDRARVELVHTARLPTGEEASFRAVRFYRYTNDRRWLHTKMTPDAGGHSVTFVVDEVEITALDGDADWIDPLASRLADAAYRFCRLASCERDLSLELNLAANLEQAAEADDAVLPAPLLVGAPENDAAQAAWEASLGEFVVDLLVTREIGSRAEGDRAGELVEERLRAWLKAKLGVSQPVAPDLELLREALETDGWIPAWNLWHVARDDRRLAAGEIDLMLAFLEEEHGAASVAQLLRSFRSADRLTELVGDLVGRPSTFEARFLAYVREQTVESADDLANFTFYDLVLHCSETVGSIELSEMWGWRLDGAKAFLLSARPMDEGFTPLSWSPDGRRMLVARQAYGDRLSLVLAGSAELEQGMIPGDAQPAAYWIGVSGWSPDGNRLAYHVRLEAPGSVKAESRIVDVRTGEEVALDGSFIAWSPRGSDVLYVRGGGFDALSSQSSPERPTRDFFVVGRDSAERRRIGEGHAAAWSPDGRRVAIVNADLGLTTVDIVTGETTTLASSEALREKLGFRPTLSSPEAFSLAWSPDGEWIALGASRVADGEAMEGAIVMLRDGEQRILRRERGSIYDLAWAPHGRWLRILTLDEQGPLTTVIGRDGSLIVEKERAFGSWSSDGDFLLMTGFTEQGVQLQVLELETGKREDIDLPGHCWPAVWNPRGPVSRPATDD